MKRRLLALVASFAIAMPVVSFAADDEKPADPKPAGTSPAGPAAGGAAGGQRGAGGGQRGGAAGGRFGQGGGPGGPGGGIGGLLGGGNRDALTPTITILGEVNLGADFTLTAEQKEKIQAIRDDYKKQQEKWRAEHESELKKIQDQFAELRNNNNGGQNGGNREKFQALAQSSQDLLATAPKADEFIAQIKNVLTTEQLKKFEAKEAERRTLFGAANGQQGRFGNRGGNNAGGAGANAGGAGAAGGANNGGARQRGGARGGARGGGARGGAAGGA